MNGLDQAQLLAHVSAKVLLGGPFGFKGAGVRPTYQNGYTYMHAYA